MSQFNFYFEYSFLLLSLASFLVVAPVSIQLADQPVIGQRMCSNTKSQQNRSSSANGFVPGWESTFKIQAWPSLTSPLCTASIRHMLISVPIIASGQRTQSPQPSPPDLLLKSVSRHRQCCWALVLSSSPKREPPSATAEKMPVFTTCLNVGEPPCQLSWGWVKRGRGRVREQEQLQGKNITILTILMGSSSVSQTQSLLRLLCHWSISRVLFSFYSFKF